MDDSDPSLEAIKRISALLPSAEMLSRTRQIRSDVVKKRDIVSGKLATLVQTQLSETGFALDLLGDNVERAVSVRERFRFLVEQCAAIDQLLNHKDYPNIRAIRTARKNIDTALRLYGMYEEIPTTAKRLGKSLQSKDVSLKDAYFEIKRLFRIKDKAHIQGDQHAMKFLDLFEQSFQNVLEVTALLETQIMEVISECVDIAGDDPALLVSTLQIVEMEDASKTYKIFSNLKQKNRMTMKEKVFVKLEESIAEFFAKAFNDFPVEDEKLRQSNLKESMAGKAADTKPDKIVSATLKVGKKVINDLQFISQYMVPCFPPSYDILRFYESRYTKWFSSRLVNVTADTSHLTSGTFLDCLKFISEYKSGLLAIGIEDSSAMGILESNQEMVLEAFLAFQRKKLASGFQNILASSWNEEPKRVNDKHWLTAAPLDMFTLVNTLISSSMARLNGRNFIKVVQICCESIKEFQEKQIKGIEARAVEKDESFIVALINDCNLCQENLESVQEKCIEHVKSSDDREAEDFEIELEQIFESTIDGFVQVGNRAVFILVDQMIKLIKDSVFQDLFTDIWLDDRRQTLSKTIIATYEDFFLDYQEAISVPFYFRNVLRMSLSTLVSSYLEKFVNSKPNLENPKYLVNLENDSQVFRDGFSDERWSEYITKKMIEEQISHIIQIKALLELSSDDFGFFNAYFESIHQSYGPRGAEILSKALSLRSDINAKLRTQIISEYTSKFESDARPTQQLPLISSSVDSSSSAGKKSSRQQQQQPVLSDQLGYPHSTTLRTCSPCATKPKHLTELERHLFNVAQNSIIKVNEFVAVVAKAAAEPLFNKSLLAWTKHVLVDRIKKDFTQVKADLEKLVELKFEEIKFAEILPLHDVAEDLVFAVERIRGGRRNISQDQTLVDAVDSAENNGLTRLHAKAKEIISEKSVQQREEQRFRECKANLNAVVQGDFSYEFTKQVVDQAEDFRERGRNISEDSIAKARQKLEELQAKTATL